MPNNYDDLQIEWDRHIPGTQLHLYVVMSESAMYHFLDGPDGMYWVFKSVAGKDLEDVPLFEVIEDTEEEKAVHFVVHVACAEHEAAKKKAKEETGMVM